MGLGCVKKQQNPLTETFFLKHLSGCCRLSISFWSLDKVDSDSSRHIFCCFCVGGTLLEVPTPPFLLTTSKFKKL